MKLLYFRADGCGVCHRKRPVAEEIARAHGLPLETFDVEDDAGRAESEARRIRGIPTLALADGERVRFRLVGAMITPENVAQLLARIPPRDGPPAP
ncbi:MAG: thioredoxin family protein [Gemmatimonadota bacterium]